MQIVTESLDYYFDFADPVAYAISTQIEGWARKLGLGVRWFAVPFMAATTPILEVRAKAGQELASAYDFPLFPRFETDSRPACRILNLTDPAHRAQLTMRLFQAWYATDLPPYSDLLLDGLARDCFVDREAMRSAVLDEQHGADSSLADGAARVLAAGASSFPAIIFPSGAVLEFGDLGAEGAATDVAQRTSEHGLNADSSTRPARCYLPMGDGPETFCRWGSCKRG